MSTISPEAKEAVESERRYVDQGDGMSRKGLPEGSYAERCALRACQRAIDAACASRDARIAELKYEQRKSDDEFDKLLEERDAALARVQQLEDALRDIGEEIHLGTIRAKTCSGEWPVKDSTWTELQKALNRNEVKP